MTKDLNDVVNVIIAQSYIISGVNTSATSSNLKALEEAKLRASNVHRARNIGAEATDITQQAAAALLRGGAIQAPQVSVSNLETEFSVASMVVTKCGLALILAK